MDIMTKTFDFDHPPSRRFTRSIKWDGRPKNTPQNVIPLWVADMDFPAPACVVEALKERAEHGVLGYTMSDHQVEDAVIEWLHLRYSWDIDRSWLMIFPGVVSALYMTVSALTKPGEGVVIMPPVYHPFFECVQRQGRRIIANPLIREGEEYRVDWDRLDTLLTQKKSSLLIFCSPHNPVGRVWERNELLRLADLMRRHPDLHVLSDEVHSDLIMPDRTHIPLAKVSDSVIASRLITARSISKTFNLAGLKTATLIVSDAALREKLSAQLYLTGAGLPNPFGLTALVSAYRHGLPWLEGLIDYIWDNYLYLDSYLAQNMKNWILYPMQGTYLAWVRIAGLPETSSSYCDRLRQEAGVWLEAGSTYGEPGEGHVRINLGTSRAFLSEALDRIRAFSQPLT